MVSESVQAVRKAEVNAAQIEKEALAKKEAILETAKQSAKSLVATRIKEAQVKAEAAVRQAEDRSKEILEESKSKAEKEVSFMKEIMKSKEQAAIDLVLASVI